MEDDMVRYDQEWAGLDRVFLDKVIGKVSQGDSI
jgi:hypothetical protein